jgi:hypothetical protein
MRKLAKEVNNMSDPAYYMIGRLYVPMDPIINDKWQQDYNMDVKNISYSRKIKLLINELISEAKKWNEDFKKVMNEVVTLPVANSDTETRMLDDVKISMEFREDI